MHRRNFISLVGLGALAPAEAFVGKNTSDQSFRPVVVSTWAPNVRANEAAWQIIENKGSALDAIVQGVMVAENDPDDTSVGYGGLPDRDGRVTLDACIMDHLANIGAVMCLEHIRNPIAVARLVMEKTPHVQLVGEGALQLALKHGFKRENLLTEKSRNAWKAWLRESKYDPMTTVNELQQKAPPNHDTIGMLALDAEGHMAGGCSTSGMAYKMHGRVGDSPIIGAGLYVDQEVGAASATGVGEEVVRICGSHAVVEAMRQGLSPTEACKTVIERLVKKRGEKHARNLQIGFVAINATGKWGCYSLTGGFTMAVRHEKGSEVVKASSLL